MDAAARHLKSKQSLATWLAGMEGGTVGVLWMLVWLGLSSVWQQRSFWTAENLMATAFDRNSMLAPIFAWATCAGLALYVVIYSLLGAAFALTVRGRVPRGTVMLLAVTFALAWYYFSFRWVFKLALPLVALLHVEHATLVGHLLYGTFLGRFPLYFDRLMSAAPPEARIAPPMVEAAPAEAAAAKAGEPPPEGPQSEECRGPDY
jgi:cation transport ATPase